MVTSWIMQTDMSDNTEGSLPDTTLFKKSMDLMDTAIHKGSGMDPRLFPLPLLQCILVSTVLRD